MLRRRLIVCITMGALAAQGLSAQSLMQLSGYLDDGRDQYVQLIDPQTKTKSPLVKIGETPPVDAGLREKWLSTFADVQIVPCRIESVAVNSRTPGDGRAAPGLVTATF